MGTEAQYAVWHWVVPPSPTSPASTTPPSSVGWHPCFSLPANRYVSLSSLPAPFSPFLPLLLFHHINTPSHKQLTCPDASFSSLPNSIFLATTHPSPTPPSSTHQSQHLLSPFPHPHTCARLAASNTQPAAVTIAAFPAEVTGRQCRQYVRKARIVQEML
jgi:hypothetical protein